MTQWSTVEEFLKVHPTFEDTGDRIKCTLTGHEMPPTLELLEKHLTSKRYLQAKDQEIDLSKYPHIVQSDKSESKLYCTVTFKLINKSKKQLEEHVKGLKYQYAVLKAEKKKEEEEKEKEEKEEEGEDEEGLWIPEEYVKMEKKGLKLAKRKFQETGKEDEDEDEDEDGDEDEDEDGEDEDEDEGENEKEGDEEEDEENGEEGSEEEEEENYDGFNSEDFDNFGSDAEDDDDEEDDDDDDEEEEEEEEEEVVAKGKKGGVSKQSLKPAKGSAPKLTPAPVAQKQEKTQAKQPKSKPQPPQPKSQPKPQPKQGKPAASNNKAPQPQQKQGRAAVPAAKGKPNHGNKRQKTN